MSRTPQRLRKATNYGQRTVNDDDSMCLPPPKCKRQQFSSQKRLRGAARAFRYADDPVGATGMTVKDYRGKNGERAI